ncbi:hypothetical protein CHH92_21585 [Bacillus sonorensis]|uniref:Uncharacterized protein n=2 Tax=Bacillus sonorensis TaxID=119858 RepID=M5P7N4_9BACI|nr:hypothetical protein BSONL12_06238 [Bacillus sonorensis L12]PAD58210.1 hypothetical protein CHH92_21585 [Bacillus sonorensis]
MISNESIMSNTSIIPNGMMSHTGIMPNEKLFNELIENGFFSQQGKGVFFYVQNNNVFGASGSAFSFGENSTNTVINNNASNNDLLELTQTLLNEIKNSQLDAENQEQLKELVEAATSEASSEKPKKAILKSFIDSANTIIQTAANSTNLISAFEKWSAFFS